MQILTIIVLLLWLATSLNAAPLSPYDIRPVLVGSCLPELILADHNGKPFDLKKEIAKKPAILDSEANRTKK